MLTMASLDCWVEGLAGTVSHTTAAAALAHTTCRAPRTQSGIQLGISFVPDGPSNAGIMPVIQPDLYAGRRGLVDI